jgi:hypothetical protein
MLSGVGCLPSYTTCPWLASDESTCNTDDHEDVRAVDSRRHVTSRHPSMGCRVSKNQPTNQFRGFVFAITHISPLSVPSSTTNNRVVDVPPYSSPQLAERYSLLLIRLLPPRAPVPSTGDWFGRDSPADSTYLRQTLTTGDRDAMTLQGPWNISRLNV